MAPDPVRRPMRRGANATFPLEPMGTGELRRMKNKELPKRGAMPLVRPTNTVTLPFCAGLQPLPLAHSFAGSRTVIALLEVCGTPLSGIPEAQYRRLRRIMQSRACGEALAEPSNPSIQAMLGCLPECPREGLSSPRRKHMRHGALAPWRCHACRCEERFRSGFWKASAHGKTSRCPAAQALCFL